MTQADNIDSSLIIVRSNDMKLTQHDNDKISTIKHRNNNDAKITWLQHFQSTFEL